MALADLSTRDRVAGTQPMLYSMPRIKPDYALIKLGAAALLALLFCLPAGDPDCLQLPGLGALAAHRRGIHGGARHGARAPYPDAQGVHGRLPALPLSGAQWRAGPGLDFAGWNGVATGSTRVGYMFAAALFGLIAVAKHRWDVAREN